MNNLQEKLQEYKKANHLTQTAIAKELNVAGSALNAWEKGTYKGDNNKLSELVSQFLDRVERRSIETQSIKMDFDFVETSIFDTIYEAVKVSDAYRQIRVIVGDSGVGKTKALKYISDHRKNSIYVPVYKGIRKNRFLDKLCEAAKIPGGGSFDTKFELLVKNLEGDRMIIVDEAEHLPIDAVDALRRINDFTGCCIILAGLPIFLDRLAKYPEYTYIFNRMAIPIRLKRLKENDTENLVKTMIPAACQITAAEWAGFSNNLGRNLKTIAQESLRVAKLNNIALSNTGRFRQVIKKITREMSYQLTK